MPAEEARPPFYRRRASQVAAAAAVLIAAVVILLPYGIKYAIERQLMAMGAASALIDNVDFNPLTGTLVVEKLRVVEDGSSTPFSIERLSVNLDLTGALRKRVFARDISVEGLDLTVRELPGGEMSYGGLTPAGAREERKRPWGWGFSGLRVTESRVEYAGADLRTYLGISELKAAGLKTWEPGAGTGLAFTGSVNGSELTIEGDAAPLSATPAFGARVALKGLGLKPFGALAGLAGLSGMLDVDARVEASSAPGGGLAFSKTGAVTIRDAGFSAGGMDFGAGNIDWNGTASWGGADEDGGGVSASGKAAVRGASVVWPSRETTLLAFDSLDVPAIAASPTGKVTAGAVAIEGLRSIGPEQGDSPAPSSEGPGPVFTVKKVKVADVAVAYPKSVAVGGVELAGMAVVIRRLSDGELHMLGGLAGERGESKAGRDGARARTGEEGKEKGRGMRITVKTVQATGGSVFRFIDEGAGYGARVAFDELTVAGISNAPGEKKGHLAVEAVINEYARLTARGTVEPFAGGLTMSLNGDVTALDLPPLSPYSKASIGYTIASGHMDAAFSLGVDRGVIDGKSNVVLHNFAVTPADKGVIDQFTKELSMPLETALKLLRDKDGNVRLEVPIEGDVASPRFELAGVVNKALGRAVKKAAIAYLKYTLQPYGTYLTVVNLARYLGEAAFGVRLDPIFFEQNETELGENDLDYLAHVSSIMSEKPEVEVKLCGFSVPGEGGRVFGGPSGTGGAELSEAVRERLLGLARERAEAAKGHLVAERGVDPDRLFICHPEIDKAKDARPRVELLI